jgi:histidine triad (HIT) family protein
VTHETEDDCPFCGIVSGADAGVEVVCEATSWIAFFPDEPATLGHTLIIPRRHVSDFWELEPSEAAEMGVAAETLGRAIRAALAPKGMNLISSAGAIAEQTVFHTHLHLVPRWTNDNFGEIWTSTYPWGPGEEGRTAEQIRAICRS